MPWSTATLHITATKKVRCRTARRVIRLFRVKEHRVQHGDGSLANTYYTLPAAPGWRCGLASGGGGCRYKRTNRRAWFEVR